MSSGINNYFTGRTEEGILFTIGRGWASGEKKNEKMMAYHVYAFKDELTNKVVDYINKKLIIVAQEQDSKHHTTDGFIIFKPDMMKRYKTVQQLAKRIATEPVKVYRGGLVKAANRITGEPRMTYILAGYVAKEYPHIVDWYYKWQYMDDESKKKLIEMGDNIPH